MLFLVCAVPACDSAQEAPRTRVPVLVDHQPLASVTTDLGYTVKLSAVRLVISGLTFTVAGEVHTVRSWHQELLDLIVPSAHAHPGHYQGGEVAGELTGRFVIAWPAAAGAVTLGDADIVVATYDAANFMVGIAEATDFAATDPLVAHTAELVGTAARDGRQLSFVVRVDAPGARELVGVPFEAIIATADNNPIVFHFRPEDPLEGDTALDGVDFFALDPDATGTITIAPDQPATEDAYNVVRRALLTHDHYEFSNHKE